MKNRFKKLACLSIMAVMAMSCAMAQDIAITAIIDRQASFLNLFFISLFIIYVLLRYCSLL